MKENDMLEQMFSAVAQLLGQREEAMLERIEALEKKVEELEQKLQEAEQAGAPVAAAVAGIVEGDAGEDAVESDVVLEDSDIEEEVIAGGDIDEPLAEPEMEIELEFFDENEDIVIEEVEVEESDDVAVVEENVGDEEDGWAEEYNEGDVEDEGPVLVVDKARPDWYDWEVDIPGSYIEDIWDGIGLNDRLLFLKELFNGDEIDFSETLDVLNEMTTLAEAVEYIRGRYPFWDEESDEVYRFYMTVRRRFNKQKQEG